MRPRWGGIGARVGASRLVMGSDYPVGEDDPVGFLRRCGLAGESLAAVSGDVNPDASRYLNRLSDLLWTMARWQEGKSRPVRTVE